jgi:hypothetical protein
MPSALKHPSARYVQNTNIVRRDIADEILLVPIRGELADMQRIFALDETSDFIWQRLDGQRSVEEILTAILEDFDVGADQASADLDTFIQELLDADLIQETT